MAAIIFPPSTTTKITRAFLSPLSPEPPKSPIPPIPSFPLCKTPLFPHNPKLTQTPHPPLSKLPSLPTLLPQNNPPSPNNHGPISPFSDFFSLLHLSVHYADVALAVAVHAAILKQLEDTHLSNSLIVAYLKLGRPSYARKVFDEMSRRDVVSYTALISGFAKLAREDEAVGLFFEMRESGIEPNEYTFVAILTACMRVSDFELGFQVHALAIKTGYLGCTYISNVLMGFYGKCGCLSIVLKLFDKMPQRDIASWNTVASCLVKELMYERALVLFHDMLQTDNFRVDYFTLSILLVASAGCFASMAGRELHAHALRSGFEINLSVNNALIGFYRKCGNVKNVVVLFERMPVKDVITWTEMVTTYMEFGLVESAVEFLYRMPVKNCVSYNALLAGFCQNGEASRALGLFCRMVEEGIELSDFTLTSVVNACGLLMETKTSEQIHGFVLKFGFGSNDCIETALLDMCTRCGRMADAKKMFHRWPSNQNNSIIWTSMICGYARYGQPDEAISLFCLGQAEGTMTLDEVASAAVLGVCGMLGFRVIAEQIHCHSLKSGFMSDIGVGNATISSYCKCGNLEDGIKVFKNMPKHDVVSWNGLMAGHILHRQGDKTLALWMQMVAAGVQPDSVTILLIISAYRCTKSNLVDHCRRFFRSIKSTYNIEPTSEHYASLVDVLGHWGLLEEAEEEIRMMPREPEASVWRALLDSCRVHLNTAVGKQAAKQILAMEPQNPSTYVLVSNLYSASGRWHCSDKIRGEMREHGFQKRPVRSWIIHQNKIHSFYARDKSHLRSKDIYSGLQILVLESIRAGYVPDTSFVLHEVEEHQKTEFLFYHSAKLAVTYGLLMTRPGKPVRVMKNIVLCGDCHTFFKYVSVVTKREIHVRDTSGFHCFSNGRCSCKDQW